jgi:hypothetical protein
MFFKKMFARGSDDADKTSVLDIIIFNKDGTPVMSKSQLFKEGDLAAGFLSAINTFIGMITADTLSSITIGNQKILFKHSGDLIGALILDKQQDEALAADMLARLMDQIASGGVENAEKVLSNFLTNEIKQA